MLLHDGLDELGRGVSSLFDFPREGAHRRDLSQEEQGLLAPRLLLQHRELQDVASRHR